MELVSRSVRDLGLLPAIGQMALRRLRAPHSLAASESVFRLGVRRQLEPGATRAGQRTLRSRRRPLSPPDLTGTLGNMDETSPGRARPGLQVQPTAANLSRPTLGRRLARELRFHRESLHFRLWVANRLAGLFPEIASGRIRTRLYRLAGIRIGPHSVVLGNLNLVGSVPDFYSHLVIGSGVSIAPNVTISLDAEVLIDDGASVGPFTRIYSASHLMGPGSRRRLAQVIRQPVTIGKGSCLGVGSMVLSGVSGVSVGNGAIVAAGAVITKDVPPNTFWEGNPAVYVRSLPGGDR